MRILDINGKELHNPDLSKGRLKPDKLFIRHHDAKPEVKEQFHMEVVATHPNGGRDMDKVIDVPYSPAVNAYDEYEDIQRYIEYTVEELETLNAPTPLEDVESMVIDLEYRLTMLELGV